MCIRDSDRNAVFEITHHIGVAPREGDLVGGNGHGQRDALLGALRAVVVVHRDGRNIAGQEHDRADGPDVEAANVVLAAHEIARERRRNLASVPGQDSR